MGMKLKMKNESPNPMPEYKTPGSAGMDLRAFDKEGWTLCLKPGSHMLIHTGIYAEIPEGYEGQVRSRSGLAAKHGVIVLNAPGTIDSDYRGEICVVLANFGQEDFIVRNGDRIAQLVICPVVQAEIEEVAELESSTERGGGGFGHTGVK